MAPKPTPTNTPPTAEDVNAIGTAAATAATVESESGGTPEQAGNAAAAAAQAEAESRGIHLPPEVIQQIARASAAATVTELAKQGALSPAEPEAKPDEDEDQDEDGEGSEAPAAEGEQPPRKRTAAEKFLSAYKR